VIAAAAQTVPMRCSQALFLLAQLPTEAVIVTTIHSERGPGLGKLIDVPTLAGWLGISVRHVRRLVAEKRIPYIKVGYFVRFDTEQVRYWLDGHSHQASA
jgi:excisionase family DNA binding protein